jgi:hypothetical protein
VGKADPLGFQDLGDLPGILRFLQTLTEVAKEKNSTTILSLPIDLLTVFLQKKEKE